MIPSLFSSLLLDVSEGGKVQPLLSYFRAHSGLRSQPLSLYFRVQSVLWSLWNSWWNSDLLTCKTLGCSSVWSEVHKNYSRMEKHVSDTWLTRVTCLGPPPLKSWWNSDLFTCKTLYCRSPGTRVRYYTLLEAVSASSGLQRPKQAK